jgi:hypothetical protein
MEISKRDYFAGQALIGLLSSNRSNLSREDAAAEAFELADAMLKHSKTLRDPIEIDPDELERRGKGSDVLPKLPE